MRKLRTNLVQRQVMQFFALKIDAANAAGDSTYETWLLGLCLDLAKYLHRERHTSHG